MEISSQKSGTIRGLLSIGTKELSYAGIEEALIESEHILMRLLMCSRSELYLSEGTQAPEDVQKIFLEIIERRKSRKPLAYLLGEAYFGGQALKVGPACLIPRPETEILVEGILKNIPDQFFRFLDIGTGSGAIAIAILLNRKNAEGALIDISEEALKIAKQNIKGFSLENRAEILCSDLFKAIPRERKWDVIVSNPPYLADPDWGEVSPEIKYEPRLALDGGKDGLDFYRRIIPEAREHLTERGILALEVGLGQDARVCKWLREAGYANIQVFKDHLQINRALIAQWK